MRIGFVGPGGTGKTTIAKPLAEAKGLPLMTSPSRECFAHFGVKTEDDQRALMPAKRFALQRMISEKINAQVEDSAHGVFERTPLDNFFYLLSHAGDAADEQYTKELEQRVIDNMRRFDVILFFPIYPWPSIDDGMRTQSFPQRLLMQWFLRGFMGYTSLSYITVPNISPERRVQWALGACR